MLHSCLCRKLIAEHPLKIMNYAARHGYTEMADSAAPLTLHLGTHDVWEVADVKTYVAWVCAIEYNPTVF